MYAHYMQNAASDCGIASLKTVLAQLNLKIKNINNIYQHYNIKQDQGLSLSHLIKILSNYGIYSDAYEVDCFEELKNVEKFPMLLVVENDGLSHYIVVHGINERTFTISDPAKSEINEVDEAELKKIFMGYALCINKINYEKKPVTLDSNMETNSGELLYREIMLEIPLKTKLRMVVLMFFKYLLPISATFLIQYFMETIGTNFDVLTLSLSVSSALVIILLFYKINIYEGMLKVSIENRMQSKVLSHYYHEKMQEITVSENSDNVTGYFWNLLTSVSGLLEKFYFKLHLSYVVFLGLVLSVINPYLLLSLFSWSLIFGYYVSKQVNKMKNNERDIIGTSTDFSYAVERNIESSLDIHLFSKKQPSEDFIKSKMNNYLESKLKITKTDLRISSTYQVLSTCMMITAFIIFGVSYLLESTNSFINITNGIFIISLIVTSVSPVVQTWIEYQRSSIAIDHIQSVNDYSTKKINQNKTLLNLAGINSIELNNIDFEYGENSPIFQKMNLKIKKGEILGIKGKNGTGKTTLIKMLSGVLSPNAGQINLNKGNLKKTLEDTNINEYISMYSPEFSLYNNSITRNVSFKVFNEELTELEKKGYKDSLNLKLHPSYAIQSGGKNLSQGQKQKILLMRTLYQEKDIYIFDEPTGNLDDDSKMLLIEEIKYLAKKKQKIVILISHEVEVLRCATRIVELKNNQVEEV